MQSFNLCHGKLDYFLYFSILRCLFQLDQASLGLSREYLNRGFSDKLVLAYYDYMVDIAALLGADRARAEVELKDSLQFEMKLANVSKLLYIFVLYLYTYIFVLYSAAFIFIKISKFKHFKYEVAITYIILSHYLCAMGISIPLVG